MPHPPPEYCSSPRGASRWISASCANHGSISIAFDAKLEPEVSPITKVTEKSAPILLVHGDKDELVPIEHSKNIVPLLEKAKVPVKLVTIEGAGHGFTPKQNVEQLAPATMDWFEKHLAEKK